jgi:single-strand DNA-binding protein
MLRQLESGKTVCNFTLAVNRKYKGADGKRPTVFFEIVVWDKRGESLAGLLKQGMRVYVSGETQPYSYTGKDGTKHVEYRVILGNIEILSPKKKEAEVEDYPGDDSPFPEDEPGGEA